MRRFLQVLKRGMVVWPRMGAEKVGKTGQILNRHWRRSLQNFLGGLDTSRTGKGHMKVIIGARAALQQVGNTWVEGFVGGRWDFSWDALYVDIFQAQE